MLAALAGVTGAATGLFNPASTGLLPEVVPDEELQPANALRSAAISGSEILGPALAGVLVAAVGAGWAIAVDAATFAISAVCLACCAPCARAAGAGVVPRRPPGGLGRVPLAPLGVDRGGLHRRGEHDLGRLERARADGRGARPGWRRRLGHRARGRRCGGTRGQPRRDPCAAAQAARALRVDGGPVRGAARLPGRRRPGRRSSRSAPFCSRRRADARHVGLGRRRSSATSRDESLSRVSAYDWFGSFAFYPLGLALWGVVAGAIGIHEALWLAFGLLAASSAAPAGAAGHPQLQGIARGRAGGLGSARVRRSRRCWRHSSPWQSCRSSRRAPTPRSCGSASPASGRTPASPA